MIGKHCLSPYYHLCKMLNHFIPQIIINLYLLSLQFLINLINPSYLIRFILCQESFSSV